MAGVNIAPNDSNLLTIAIVSATATANVISSVTNKIIRVYRLFLVASGTTTLTFCDGSASVALSGGIPLVANGSMTLDMDGTPWFTTSMGNAFTLVSSGSSITVSGNLYYTQVPFYG
jgi:hypothetical protein